MYYGTIHIAEHCLKSFSGCDSALSHSSSYQLTFPIEYLVPLPKGWQVHDMGAKQRIPWLCKQYKSNKMLLDQEHNEITTILETQDESMNIIVRRQKKLKEDIEQIKVTSRASGYDKTSETHLESVY